MGNVNAREPFAFLKDKRFLITGAASGIGRAAARGAVARGARAAAVDIDAGGLKSLAAEAGPDLRSWTCDLTDRVAVERTVSDVSDWLGAVDVLLHIAGLMKGQGASIEQLSPETWERVLDVNLTATFHVTAAVAPAMIRRGTGTIILTSSEGGVTKASGSLAYGASKGGMHGFSLSLEAQLEGTGVRVLELLPRVVDTPLIRGSISEGVAAGVERDYYDRLLQGAIRPADVAAALLVLASDDAAVIRGTVSIR